MFLKFFISIVLILFMFNCSNSNKEINISNNIEKITPQAAYIEAMKNFEDKKISESINIFESIVKIYPLSNEAIQSQIMLGFIDYSILNYDSAILKFSRLIKRYPSLKNLDYVYYMRALCYYEQISHESLDGKYNLLALENLDQVINRFPDSEFAKDSYQKIILVNSNIAAKHMDIGRFYQKNKKYTAALNRYKLVVENFSETKFTPEAIYRISEIYYSIGMIEDATKMATILAYNYPSSKWYELSYNNLKPKEKESIFSNSLKNIFNK